MRLRTDVVLRRVADTWLVVPLISAADITGIMTLNDTGAFLWMQLESGATAQAMALALSARYGLAADQALADTQDFLNMLTERGYALS